MLKAIIVGVLMSLGLAGVAAAQNCPAFPYSLADGSTAYGSEVMANFNNVTNCINSILVGPHFTGPLTINSASSGYAMDVDGNVNNFFGSRVYNVNNGAAAVSFIQLGNNTNAAAAHIDLNSSNNISNYGGANALAIVQGLNAPMVFATAGAQQMAIDGAGNVGIGGFSAGFKLDIVGNVNGYYGERIFNGSSGSAAVSYLQLGNDASCCTAALALNSSGNSNFGAPNTLWLVNGLSAPLVLGTSFQPRITIDGSGNVGVNDSYPGYLFQVNGVAAGNNAWLNISDARLKTNIAPITNGLDMVMQLRGVRFQWRAVSDRAVGKDLKLDPTETHVGFIAQEVQAVVPEAVSAPKDSSGLYGLKEADLVPVLVEAIKELQAEVNQLKAAAAVAK